MRPPPDLVLLDIMMEPMDGWETLERIKTSPALRHIPVLMLTAKPLTPEEANEYGPYIEDYILKPTTHHQLYEPSSTCWHAGTQSPPISSGRAKPAWTKNSSTSTNVSQRASISIAAS